MTRRGDNGGTRPAMKMFLKALIATLGVAAASTAIAAETAAGGERKFACADLETRSATDPAFDGQEMLQGSDGWFFRTGADLSWRFALSEEGVDYLARFARALKARGAAIGYVAVPPRGLIYFDMALASPGFTPILRPEEGGELYREVIERLRQSGAVVPDLLAAAQASDELLFFRRDHHWTPEYARLTAETFARAYRESVGAEGLDSVKFDTSIVSDATLKGQMARALSSFCSDTIPAEPIRQYETRRLASERADLGLFGNPEGSFRAVLIGSSYSDLSHSFNFDGFLSDALGVEVANEAISGGHLMRSAISYFSSTGYRDNPPQLVIWESPIYYNYYDRSILDLRQVIPAIGGECAADAAIARQSGELASTDVAMAVPPDAGVSGASHFIFLELENRAFANFSFQIDYADGDSEVVPVDRSYRYVNEGRFFLEFSGDIPAAVEKITVRPAGAETSPYKIRVCKAPSY